MPSFLSHNLFLLTVEYARRTFDTTEWNGRRVQDIILTKGVPEIPMGKDEVRLFVTELLS